MVSLYIYIGHSVGGINHLYPPKGDSLLPGYAHYPLKELLEGLWPLLFQNAILEYAQGGVVWDRLLGSQAEK